MLVVTEDKSNFTWVVNSSKEINTHTCFGTCENKMFHKKLKKRREKKQTCPN